MNVAAVRRAQEQAPIVDICESSRQTLRQLWRFGLIGAASTAAYALLFWLLRSAAPGMIANAVALVATAVVNTAANRRFTFGVQGRAGLAGDHAGGLIALALALLTTSVSMAACMSCILAHPRQPNWWLWWPPTPLPPCRGSRFCEC